MDGLPDTLVGELGDRPLPPEIKHITGLTDEALAGQAIDVADASELIVMDVGCSCPRKPRAGGSSPLFRRSHVHTSGAPRARS